MPLFPEKRAGYDLHSVQDLIISAHKRMKVHTEIAMELPPNWYGNIRAQSGLTIKHNIDVGAGVIDNDYRGELIVCLINNGDENFHIKRYDKIAQLILTTYSSPHNLETEHISPTDRGRNGFGSTGPPNDPGPHYSKQGELSSSTIPLHKERTIEKGGITISPTTEKMANTNTLPVIPPRSTKSNTTVLEHKEKSLADDPTNYRWHKINNASVKVTIRLPWKTAYERGSIQKHTHGFIIKMILTQISNKSCRLIRSNM